MPNLQVWQQWALELQHPHDQLSNFQLADLLFLSFVFFAYGAFKYYVIMLGALNQNENKDDNATETST